MPRSSQRVRTKRTYPVSLALREAVQGWLRVRPEVAALVKRLNESHTIEFANVKRTQVTDIQESEMDAFVEQLVTTFSLELNPKLTKIERGAVRKIEYRLIEA